ncbi:hypothetical protein V2J09_012711 [Rumex salicifolius]
MEKHLRVVLVVLAAACFLGSNGELKRLNHPMKSNQDGWLTRFLVVGDWGRKGFYNQSQVATQMGNTGEKLEIDFIVSTGDNFYENGLTGMDDPDFFESFSDVYTSPGLHKQWFTVLGNHDYRGDVQAQISPSIRQKDNRWFCLRSFILNAGNVDIFFVDTTPFVDEYFVDPGNHTYDWRGVLPRHNYLSTLLKDLSSELKKSSANWKIVVGHHTIKSAGYHGATKELVAQLEPILKENNVDFYMNGHDHCLEHIISAHSSTQYVTSGGGSKAWRGDERKWNPDELKFYYDGQGFLSVEINQTVAKLAFYDVFGNVLYEWGTFKIPLHSNI